MNKAFAKKKQLVLLLVVLGSVFVFGQGCWFGYVPEGPLESGSGDLQVQWQFDGTAVCPLDVDEMVLEVRTIDGARVFNDVVVSCNDGLFRVPSLAEGDYILRLKGVDIDSAITWESSTRRISVESDATAVVSVDLLPTE